jgi:hypothetical protein
MREDKYDILLNVSIVLLIVSATVLGISVYRTYLRDPEPSKANAVAIVKPTLNKERDSLQVVYRSAIKAIDTNMLRDPKINLDKESQANLTDVVNLKNEITTLLKDQSSTADLASAKLKIEELQLKVALLQNRYLGVEADNKRLQALLNQLMSTNKGSQNSTTSTTAFPASEKLRMEKNNVNTTTANTPTATAGDLHLFTVAENNNKEFETSYAEDAEKMIGTFSLNNLSDNTNTEVMVVVLQPDGKVVKNSVWESGTFETKQGKKVYSRKISFDGAQKDKQINFSLTPDNFVKGEYTLQVWYNGRMIAKTFKTLS